ncbi:MAG: hypothetical protein ACO3LE_07260, partial [Bdellovibrionota bacterium]
MNRSNSKSQKKLQFDRRDFLKATGVGALASMISPIQFLNSNLYAQSAIQPLKFFGTFMIGHGGSYSRELPTRRNLNSSNIVEREVGVPVFPNPAMRFSLTSNTSIAMEPLNNFLRLNANGEMVLNEVFDSRWAQNGLIDYLNVFHNFYVPWYYGHGRAVLGDPFTGHNADAPQAGPHLSQVVAQSPLYSPLQGGATLNPLLVNFDHAKRLIDPTNLNSAVDSAPTIYRTDQAYQATIGVAQGLSPNGNSLGVSKLLEEVQALKNQAQVSANDRQLLEAHEDRLLSLLQSVQNGSCAFSGALPPSPTWNQVSWNADENSYRAIQSQLISSYLALATAACGRSLIANMNPGYFIREPNSFGEFHSEVVHRLNGRPVLDEAVPRMAQAMQPWLQGQMGRSVFDIALALKNTPAGDGKNLLDHSLLVIGFEAGTNTHDSRGLTIYTIGGAAGRMKTGFYIDASQQNQSYGYNPNVMSYPLMTSELNRKGLPYINFLNTICAAAGLSPDRYELNSG